MVVACNLRVVLTGPRTAVGLKLAQVALVVWLYWEGTPKPVATAAVPNAAIRRKVALMLICAWTRCGGFSRRSQRVLTRCMENRKVMMPVPNWQTH